MQNQTEIKITKRCVACNRFGAAIDNYCPICGAELIKERHHVEVNVTVTLGEAAERLNAAYGPCVSESSLEWPNPFDAYTGAPSGTSGASPCAFLKYLFDAYDARRQ